VNVDKSEYVGGGSSLSRILRTSSGRLTLSPARRKAERAAEDVHRRCGRDSSVTKTSFQPNDWVLLRNKSGKKFKSKWFGPYKVIQSQGGKGEERQETCLSFIALDNC
jgi:hypothetical protein